MRLATVIVTLASTLALTSATPFVHHGVLARQTNETREAMEARTHQILERGKDLVPELKRAAEPSFHGSPLRRRNVENALRRAKDDSPGWRRSLEDQEMQ